jgi:DNA-binding MarR family transcriptional regulator
VTSPPEKVPQRGLLALLRAAERVYVAAIRSALDDAGFEDLPPRGIVVMASLQQRPLSVGSLSRGLGVTSQAASQLIDVLVARGFVDRTADPADRRRIVLTLSARGAAAAETITAAVASVTRRVEATTSREDRAALRRGLEVLASLGADQDDEL